MTTPATTLAALVALSIAGIVLIAAIGNDVPPSLEQALYTLIGGTIGGGVGGTVAANIANTQARKEAARLDALWRGDADPPDVA